MKKTLLFILTCFLGIQIFSKNLTEIYKAIPGNYTSQNYNDRFGTAVAMDGNYAVISVPGYKLYGICYVLYNNGKEWENIAELTLSSPAGNFGRTVSISGDIIVIGAYRAAYVYKKPSTGWANMTETAILTADKQVYNNDFGESVSISGDVVVVGDTQDNAAYVYKKPSTGWADMTETAKLKASNSVYNNEFGKNVSISGDAIAVGAYGANDREGAIYVFEKPSGGWATSTETAMLTVSGTEKTWLGFDVSISGETIVGGTYREAVYIFEKPSGGWENMTESAKLTASDGSMNDGFGRNVSFSGDHIVVGATGYKYSKGKVYYFKKPATGWENMVETKNILKYSSSQNEHFGYAICISGINVLVGAPFVKTLGENSGEVYAFNVSGGIFLYPKQRILAEEYEGYGRGEYGKSVAIDGDYAVIGAPGYNNQMGCVYVLHKDACSWKQMAILTASDGQDLDRFGFSVGISGGHIVVGATGDDDKRDGSGAVYVFSKPTAGWTDTTETAKLNISSPTSHSDLGYAVSISGNTIVAGTFAKEAAYVFIKPATGWENMTETAELKASDQDRNEKFGMSLSISGNNIVIGAYQDDDGSAYVFTKPATGWENMTETAKLKASDGEHLDFFGYSVDISGDHIVIGAKFSDAKASGSGAAYIFTKPSEGWKNMTETKKLTASDGEKNDNFGYAVGISGNNIIISAVNNDENEQNTGAAYLYTTQDGNWINVKESYKLTASDAKPGNCLGTSVAISGLNTIISDYNNYNNEEPTGAAYIYNLRPELEKNPENHEQVVADTTVIFKVEALNTDTYQWQLSTDNGKTFTNITNDNTYTGVTTTTLNVKTAMEQNNNQYRCVVANTCVENLSEAALLTIKSTTGIQSTENINISVHPNPVKDILNIQLGNNHFGIAEIYDLTGQKVKQKYCTGQDKTINLSTLKTGIYILNIQAEKQATTTKIIKK